MPVRQAAAAMLEPVVDVVEERGSGMYGDSYDLLMAGSTVGFAVNSARIAVESAEAYINETK